MKHMVKVIAVTVALAVATAGTAQAGTGDMNPPALAIKHVKHVKQVKHDVKPRTGVKTGGIKPIKHDPLYTKPRIKAPKTGGIKPIKKQKAAYNCIQAPCR